MLRFVPAIVICILFGLVFLSTVQMETCPGINWVHDGWAKPEPDTLLLAGDEASQTWWAARTALELYNS